MQVEITGDYGVAVALDALRAVPGVGALEPDPEVRALAVWVHREYGDDALTRAALLSALPLEALDGFPVSVRTADLACARAFSALRRALLDASDPGHRDALRGGVEGAEAGVKALLVLSSLIRADPDGTLLAWSRGFHRAPASMPDAASPRRSGFDVPALRVLARAAERVGQWHGRNLLDDLALRLSEPTRFDALLERVCTAHAQGELAEHAAAIEAALRFAGAQVEEGSVGWDWHHLDSLSRRLVARDQTRIGSDDTLRQCGFVTVRCPDDGACFERLRALYAYTGERVRSVGKAVNVTLSEPGPDGYRAVHLTARVRKNAVLAVRLVAPTRTATAPYPANPALPLSRRVESDTVRVFTPRGDTIVLPAGARVINFAQKIHSSFLVRTREAIINDAVDAPVDILHPLSDGDRVRLVAADEVRPPPRNWASVVPSSTRASLQHDLRTALGPWLIDVGRERVRRELKRRCGQTLDAQDIEHVLERVVVPDASRRGSVEAEARGGLHPQVASILNHVGRMEVEYRGGAIPLRCTLSPALFARYLAQAESYFRLRAARGALPVAPPRDVEVQHIEICSLCLPDSRKELVPTYAEGVVVMHRPGSGCVCEAAAAPSGLPPAAGQFFLLETSNRVGVARDVLETFWTRGVDVLEVIGMRLGGGWALVRVEVLEPETTLASLEEALRKVPDVVHVWGPAQMQDAPPAIEAMLPARSAVVAARLNAQPFPCGAEVEQVDRFYGRGRELGTLLHLVELAGTGVGGKMVRISGPLKVGKSSLVRILFRHLREQTSAVTVMERAARRERWGAYESRLVRSLRSACPESERLPDLPLCELLRHLARSRRTVPFVIAVDEAPWLFDEAERAADLGDPTDLDALVRFRETVSDLRGVLVLWIGPEASFRRTSDVAAILRASELLRVGPFSLGETAEMIRVSKLSWRYPVRIMDSAVRHLHRLTGGNPYWLALLGNEIWADGGQRSTDRLVITYEAVERARQAVSCLGEAFQDRIYAVPVAHHLDLPIARILAAKVMAHPNHETRWSMTAEEISGVLRGEGIEAGYDAVLARLGALHAQGAIELTGQSSARLAALLLADHVVRLAPDFPTRPYAITGLPEGAS